MRPGTYGQVDQADQPLASIFALWKHIAGKLAQKVRFFGQPILEGAQMPVCTQHEVQKPVHSVLTTLVSGTTPCFFDHSCRHAVLLGYLGQGIDHYLSWTLIGRQGLLGHQLEVLGLRVAFSTTAVVLAQTFVSLPFLVISLEGALRTAGQGYEQVAPTLCAGPTTGLRTVTIPLVWPALQHR